MFVKSDISRSSCQKGISTYLHNRRYLVKQHKIVGCKSCQKGVMLMLLYTEIQTVTFGHMNTNNEHLSNQISIRILSPVYNFVDTPFWHDAVNMIKVTECNENLSFTPHTVFWEIWYNLSLFLFMLHLMML
jgi:hypothetical protein